MMNLGPVPADYHQKGLLMLYQPELMQTLDILGGEAKADANVITSKVDLNKKSQYWKIVRAVETQPITDSWSPVLISTMDGKWCVARVTDDVSVPDGSNPDAVFNV